MRDYGFQSVLLVVLLLAAAASPAVAKTSARLRAAVPTHSASAALVLADSWSFGKFLGGGRTRVVQVCVVVMCLALFILMKKLS